MFTDYFDMPVLKMIFKNKKYFNVFLNKKYFKKTTITIILNTSILPFGWKPT
jgi:hypothetical protein